MIPFKDTYYENKLQEFREKCSIKEGYSIGKFKIEYELFKTGVIHAYMHSYRGAYYNFPILKEGDDTWMSVTPIEIGGCFEASRRVHGKVGIIGLGLGYFVQEILDKEKVEDVIVYEISKEVIDLYNKNFGPHAKLKLIHKDVFDVKEENFDFFFVDIYKNCITEKIAEDYILLNKKFNIKEYVFWGLEHFLLSCDNEEVSRINFPENWINMADNLGDRFYQSKYKENFIALDYKICSKLLNRFKEMFGEKN